MNDYTNLTLYSNVFHETALITNQNPIASQIQRLINSSSQLERMEYEKEIQNLLNQGADFTSNDLNLLQLNGYSISKNPKTIDRFRNFSIQNDPDLSEAIRAATPHRGLLVDKYKMYRPGPASCEETDGAAKGYDEIFTIFEKQTTEKTEIAETIAFALETFSTKLPEDHPWKNVANILDLGCGNGVQARELISSLQKHFPNQKWKLIGLDNQADCIDKCRALFEDCPSTISKEFHTRDLFSAPFEDHRGIAEIIIISHVYFDQEKINEFLEKIKEYQAKNSLLIFIHGATGTDGDLLANQHDTFMRGKPFSKMSEQLQEHLKNNDFICKSHIEESLVKFPPLTPEIERALREIKRGDYENPYKGIDENTKIFKALMELYASYPLESMESHQIETYIKALKEKFLTNRENWLKITDRVTIACPPTCDEEFLRAFQTMYEADFNDHFTKAERAHKNGHLHKAIDLLTNSIRITYEQMVVHYFEKKEWDSKNLENLVRGFQFLSKIYVENNLFSEAAGLLCYTKRWVEKFAGYEKYKVIQNINEQIEEVEQKLISGPLEIDLSTSCIKQGEADRQILLKLRNEIENEFKELKRERLNPPEHAIKLKTLFEKTEKSFKAFITKLTHDSVQLIKITGESPPCEYALVGFGSIVKGDITPYSKLEFAVLTQNEDERTRKYFQKLTNLLHLKIINLGETSLSYLGLEGLSIYDDMTPCGLAIDGSLDSMSINPFNKNIRTQGYNHSICSPESMSDLQISKKSSRANRELGKCHISASVHHMTLICGSEKSLDLVEGYEKLISQKMTEEEKRKRSLVLIADDFNKYNPELEKEVSGRTHSLKNDLYGLVNTLFDRLVDYCNIQAKSRWDQIQELQEKGIITSGASQDLLEFFTLSQQLRLTIYFRHNSDKEELNEKDEKVIYDLYYRALPFIEAMQNFFSAATNHFENPLSKLTQHRFFSDNPLNRALVDQRLCKYFEAERNLEESTEKNVDYYILSGDIKQTLGKYKEAEENYESAIRLLPPIASLKKGQLFKKIGYVRKEMGDFENVNEAYEKAEQILKNISSGHERNTKVLEDLYRSKAQLAKQQGLFSEAKKYLNASKALVRKRTQNMSEDLRYHALPDISLAANFELEAVIARDIDCHFKEAKRLLEKAKITYESYYKNPNHLHVIACEQMILFENDFYQKALSLEYIHLNLRLKLFGEKHPDISLTKNNIGVYLRILGRCQEALDYHKQALLIQKLIYGEKHITLAHSRHNIGQCYDLLGQYKLALKYYNDALDIEEQSGNVDLSEKIRFLKDKGICLTHLGLLNEALEVHEEIIHLVERFIESNQQIYPNEHPNLAAAMIIKGNCLMKLGKYHTAIEQQTIALAILKKHFGEFHPEVASCLDSIGTSFYSLGKFQQALENHQRALKIKKNIYGLDHHEVAICLTGIGNSISYLDKNEQALYYHRKALGIREKLFGKNHPLVATSMINIASRLSCLGRQVEAVSYYRQSKEIREEVLGNHHGDTLLSRNYFSMCESLLNGKDPLIDYDINPLNREDFLTLIQMVKNHIRSKDVSQLRFAKNPTGFVRLYLPVPAEFSKQLNSIRLNYWPKNFNLKILEAQHTHPHYFESLLLSGGYVHTTFRRTTNPSPYRAHRMFKNTPEERNIFFIGEINLEEEKTEEFSANSFVRFPRNLIHQVKTTKPGTLSINCVYKGQDHDFFDVFLSTDSLEDPITEREILVSDQASTVVEEILEILDGKER